MTYENQPNYLDEIPGKKNLLCPWGISKKHYCDGSHEIFNTGKSPIEFKASQAKKMAICDRSQASKLLFCNGTHTKLRFSTNSELFLCE